MYKVFVMIEITPFILRVEDGFHTINRREKLHVILK